MKQNRLSYLRKPKILQNKPQPVQKSQLTSSNQTELLNKAFRVMQFIVLGEQRIQILKQMLTERTDFSPEPLFYYVSKNEQKLDRKHLIKLFQQNKTTISDEYLKLYLYSYGCKQRIDYSAFINLIFPIDTDLIRHISVTSIKKYPHQTLVTEEVLSIFILLIQEEINLMEKLDAIKNEFIPKISRRSVKNIMRIIKKKGQCISLIEIESQHFLKEIQLKMLFKRLISNPSNLKSNAKKSQEENLENTIPNDRSQQSSIQEVLQKNFSNLFRKLSMGKNNIINLDDLEFWLVPWNKRKLQNNSNSRTPLVVSDIKMPESKQFQIFMNDI